MAIKEKKIETGNRLLTYLKEEHKWENYLFVAVSLITLVLGILILTNVLTVKDSFPVIGSFSKGFAWILVVISGIGLLYALYPFFRPSWPELKKVTWLKPLEFLGNVLRVFIFIIFLALLFVLYDKLFYELFDRLL